MSSPYFVPDATVLEGLLRSFDLNYENNVLLQDDATTAEIQARQQAYIAQSERVDLAELDSWRSYRRVWNNAITTIGPVL